jgi:heme exporter protein B
MGELLRVTAAIARKDLKVEWRTKTAFVSSLVFAVLVLAVLYFARDKTSVGDYDLAPGALWVTFTFAGMLGLNRAFLLERENRALDGLRLTPTTPTALFLGKVVGNLVFLGVVALATVGYVAVGTLLSAMVVRTRFSEVMLPVLLLPFLVPPIVSAVQLTWRILALRPLSEMTGWLSLLAAFDIIFFTLSLLLFEAILVE